MLCRVHVALGTLIRKSAKFALHVYASPLSPQNRRDFLRLSGEQGRKRGERKARVACEGRSAKNRLVCSPEIRKKLRLFCRLIATGL